MIRKTLPATQAATHSVLLPGPSPEPGLPGMPSPTGTGFFISPDGWWVTARHVLTTNGWPDGDIREKLSEISWLTKEMRGDGPSKLHKVSELRWSHEGLDIALFKLDGADFPHLKVSSRVLEEGEPVYAYGYPLSDAPVTVDRDEEGAPVVVGVTSLKPRTTSAIVASDLEADQGMAVEGALPVAYVIDKALNYGNSGGPIVATDTGLVHAACSRFQPVGIDQGNGQFVLIPSLYGVVSNLGHPMLWRPSPNSASRSLTADPRRSSGSPRSPTGRCV